MTTLLMPTGVSSRVDTLVGGKVGRNFPGVGGAQAISSMWWKWYQPAGDFVWGSSVFGQNSVVKLAANHGVLPKNQCPNMMMSLQYDITMSGMSHGEVTAGSGSFPYDLLSPGAWKTLVSPLWLHHVEGPAQKGQESSQYLFVCLFMCSCAHTNTYTHTALPSGLRAVYNNLYNLYNKNNNIWL